MFSELFKRMECIKSFILLICISSIHCAQWIDPHDMNLPKDARILQPRSNIIISDGNDHHPSVNEDTRILSQLKRTINLLLNIVTLDNVEGTIYKGSISIPKEKYNQLKQFAQSTDTSDASLNKIDHILSDILSKTTKEHIQDFVFSWSDLMHMFLFNKTTLILGGCVLVLYISYKLLRANLTLLYIMQYLAFIGFVISFTFTWIELYQDSEIMKMTSSMQLKNIPVECNPEMMSTWQFFWSQLAKEDKCLQYHESRFKDAFYAISPLTVVLELCSRAMVIPSGKLGESFGSFASGINKQLPWPINLIMFPIILIFALLLVSILLAYICGVSLKFNLFHIFNIEFGKHQTIQQNDSPSKRNYVQNIPQRTIGFKKPKKVQKTITVVLNKEKKVQKKPDEKPQIKDAAKSVSSN